MEEHIFYGQPQSLNIVDKSFSEFIFKNITLTPPEQIMHIHAETGETMTSQAFVTLSQKIAIGLEAVGVKPGNIVVLLGENSMRISAMAAACFFINAAAAPQDPNLKTHELKNIFKTYQPHFIFCNQAQSKAILGAVDVLELTAKVFFLDVDESSDSRIRGFSDILNHDLIKIQPKPVNDISKEIALIAPSSGSTGLPKGVAISHEALIAASMKMQNYLSVRPDPDGFFLQSSHLFWISGIYALLMSLTAQIPRVFLSHLSTENILSAVKKYKPIGVFLPPSEMASILKRPDLKPDDLASLKVITSGGGPMQKWIVDQMQEKFIPKPIVMPSYGCTENVTAITATLPEMDKMSVGRVDSGSKVKIVDTETNLAVGPNKVGEIRVKHPYQMIGYLNNPEATKAAYDENGWLKTGDLGYFTESEVLYIVGRIKNILKYRNMQISVTEIESLLMEMDGVQDVGIMGIPNEDDQNHIMALVVKRPGVDISEDDIKRHVEENMAAHNQIRGGVKFVDSIPKTPHNKVKRDALKELGLKLYAEGK